MPDHVTLAKGESTLPRLLREHARRDGGKTALREKEFGIWRCVTWAEYYATARLVALGLTSLGLKRGDRIVIASENVAEWFYADLGAQMLGV